jgi:16S rRNA (uracil1498-N3)-methyltransferase
LTADSVLAIPAAEQKHLRARRVRPGSVITVLDGRGDSAYAVVSNDEAHLTVLRPAPSSSQETSSELLVSVCLCAPKSASRADWAVEKLTEVGADEILLMHADRSVNRNAYAEAKLQRWSRLAAAAVKQSLRTSLPRVRVIGGVAELLELVPTHDRCILLSPDGRPLLSVLEAPANPASSNVLIVAGPEGGFTDAEEDRMVRAGCQRASLGKRRLRVETAVVTACATVCCFADARAHDV